MIYLDYAATTPMSSHALNTYEDVAKNVFANTMSPHNYGTQASQLLSFCRSKLAVLLNADPNGLYFTSGGSESNHLAIEGLAKAHLYKGKHLITSLGEHSSILSTFQKLEEEGFEVTYLPRTADGHVTLAQIKTAVRPDTILVSLGHVNSEIGTIQNVKAIGGFLKGKNILFHCDTVQSFGKLAIDVQAMHITSLAISAHKIYGPKGVGVCYVNPKAAYKPLLPNVSHENGFRPGTMNLPGIASFITAAIESSQNSEKERQRVRNLRESFVAGLHKQHVPFIIEASKSDQLPHILALRIKGVEGQQIMLAANRRGLAIATGTACGTGAHHPSPTLLAMGRTESESRELIRLSFGETTTESEMKEAARLFSQAAGEVLAAAKI